MSLLGSMVVCDVKGVGDWMDFCYLVQDCVGGRWGLPS